jgi:hypothetical protein
MDSVKANHFNSDRLLTIESDGVKIKLNNKEKEKFNARYFHPCEIISKNGSVKFYESELNSKKLIKSSVHPFVNAIQIAYGYHYPLVITPDIIWYLITSGVCEFINRNAEKFRHKLVDHEDKQKIVIETLDLNWHKIIDKFSQEIQNRTKTKVASLILNDFNTTTKCSKIVSQIVIMDSFKNYFEYEVMLICGIPEIQVKGTQQDWIRLKEKMINLLKEFTELLNWSEKLEVILDNFINVYDNKVDYDFWDQIFLLNISKMQTGYSWNRREVELKKYDGWFIYMFPFFTDGANSYVFAKENNILSRNYSGGYKIEKFSHTFNKVEFILNEYNILKNFLFVGGLIGVDKDEKNNDALTPIFGYAITEPNKDALKFFEKKGKKRKF